MCVKANPCRILWVEDELSIVRAIQIHEAMHPDSGIENCFAASIQEAERILNRLKIVIIMVDLKIKDSSGVKTVRRIAEIIGKDGPPMYVYASDVDAETRNLAIQYGAKEVFIKGEMYLLNAIIFSYHAANEQRKTLTLQAERDAYKKEKEALEEELMNLKLEYENLILQIPSKNRIQNVENVAKRIEKIQSLVAPN